MLPQDSGSSLNLQNSKHRQCFLYSLLTAKPLQFSLFLTSLLICSPVIKKGTCRVFLEIVVFCFDEMNQPELSWAIQSLITLLSDISNNLEVDHFLLIMVYSLFFFLLENIKKEFLGSIPPGGSRVQTSLGYRILLLFAELLFSFCSLLFCFFFGNFLHLMTSRQELYLMNSLLLALNYCVGIILCILVSSFQFILSLLVFSQQLMFKFLMSLEDLMEKQFTLVKRLPLFVIQKNVMGKLLYCDFRLVY